MSQQFVMCVLEASFRAPARLMPNHAPHVLLAGSLRTTATMSVTTIPLTIASPAHRANTVHRVPPFAIDVPQVIEHLKIKCPTKPVVPRARVAVTKHKRVKPSATIVEAENTNLKTVLLFVCPVTLGCINQKWGKAAAKNARKIITPTNPNKPHARRVWARKKRRIQVPPFVSSVRRDNSCPPTKHVPFANWEK
jgi:hypothetical protein